MCDAAEARNNAVVTCGNGDGTWNGKDQTGLTKRTDGARNCLSTMPVAQPDATSAEPHRFESIEAAFAALESPLLTYALRLVPTRATAEDIVQEAFMKLHGQFDEVREPRRWLYRTVHNLAFNHRRKHDRIVPLEPVGGGGDGAGSGGGAG